MILVVSHAGDEHAGPVLDALAARGAPAVLLDLADLPRRARLVLQDGRAVLRRDAGPPVDFAEVRAVWWRRPQPFDVHPDVWRPDHRQFAYAQCDEAVQGLLHSLDGARWVNHPSVEISASRKVLQLAAARRAGLPVPRTLVTNDPAAARAFVAELGGPGRAIHKALLPTEGAYRETRLVGEEELALLDEHLPPAPVILQEYVAGADVRATYVGGRLFAAEIDASATPYAIDFRPHCEEAPMRAVALPAEVEDGLRRVAAALGLAYGAFDLRRDEGGRHHFLEVNPSGQWLFVEDRTGQPITAALADLLAGR